MAFINTGNNHYGIRELLNYKPSTGEVLLNLAQALLHGPSPISKQDREIIAAYTSKLNRCTFCYESHKAAAIAHEDGIHNVIDVLDNPHAGEVSKKLSVLLTIVEKVQKSGSNMTLAEIDILKNNNITDEEIHDTVLITAAFCMYNRYVDGLGAKLPDADADYESMGKNMAENGYGIHSKN